MSTTKRTTRTYRLVTVSVQAPRTIKVRVPAGRTDRETLLRAVTKAQRQIIVTARAA